METAVAEHTPPVMPSVTLLPGAKKAYQYLKKHCATFAYGEHAFLNMVECGDVPEYCYIQRKPNTIRWFIPDKLMEWWQETINN